MANSNKTSAFLIGAAIGSVVALMLAPFSGRKMRRVTVEKTKKVIDDAKKKYQESESDEMTTTELLKRKGTEVWDKAVEGSKEITSSVKTKATEIRNSIKKEEKELGEDSK